MHGIDFFTDLLGQYIISKYDIDESNITFDDDESQNLCTLLKDTKPKKKPPQYPTDLKHLTVDEYDKIMTDYHNLAQEYFENQLLIPINIQDIQISLIGAIFEYLDKKV